MEQAKIIDTLETYQPPSKLLGRLLAKVDSTLVPLSSILILLNKESIEETPITLRSSSFL